MAAPVITRRAPAAKRRAPDIEKCKEKLAQIAIKEKSVPEVRRLLKAEPSLCKYADQQGQTMLHLAAMFGHTDIALALVKAGADPLAKNPQGETAVDLAPVVLGNKPVLFDPHNS